MILIFILQYGIYIYMYVSLCRYSTYNNRIEIDPIFFVQRKSAYKMQKYSVTRFTKNYTNP